MIRTIIATAIGALLASLIAALLELAFGTLTALLGPELPPKAVVAFNADKCPSTGWVEYKQAYGRFIRGLDKGEKRLDPDEGRLPGSVQEDEFSAHSHARPMDVYNVGRKEGAAMVMKGPHLSYGHAATPRTGDEGGAETRPKNVALLFCEKT